MNGAQLKTMNSLFGVTMLESCGRYLISGEMSETLFWPTGEDVSHQHCFIFPCLNTSANMDMVFYAIKWKWVHKKLMVIHYEGSFESFAGDMFINRHHCQHKYCTCRFPGTWLWNSNMGRVWSRSVNPSTNKLWDCLYWSYAR